MTISDDLGWPLATAGTARKAVRTVVSLVPSLTESIAVTRPEALVGATDWCTHPAGLEVPRVRGTKNPDVPKVIALRPDIVLANKEENRRKDVELLRAAGIDVWVTVIETVEQALGSLRRLFEIGLGWPAPAWLDEADDVWRPAAPAAVSRAIIPIWRDPWMVVGSSTFAGDLAARLGLANLYGDHRDRYPHLAIDELNAARPDVVVLPDEPYRFALDDGPEAFPGLRCALVQGRALTWYGPSLVTARSVLTAQLSRTRQKG